MRRSPSTSWIGALAIAAGIALPAAPGRAARLEVIDEGDRIYRIELVIEPGESVAALSFSLHAFSVDVSYPIPECEALEWEIPVIVEGVRSTWPLELWDSVAVGPCPSRFIPVAGFIRWANRPPLSDDLVALIEAELGIFAPYLDPDYVPTGIPLVRVTGRVSAILVESFSCEPAELCRLEFDVDRDGIDDGIDNCTGVRNADQANLDGDTAGDACDYDIDGDGHPQEFQQDNCPTIPNPSQADADGDLRGDACDSCPYHPVSSRADADGNGIGDVCECGDQTGDGHVTMDDALAIMDVIFERDEASPLCDTNDDALCDVRDVLGVNARIFGQPAYCERFPAP